jgi:probable phosphoglycerate mutase
VFQGLTYEQVFGEFPEHNAGEGMVGLESTPERGESILDARERVLAAWDDVVTAAGPDDTILVVTHGGPIYVLLAHLKGVDLPTALADFDQDNCALNEIRYDGSTGDTEICRENDTSYRAYTDGQNG